MSALQDSSAILSVRDLAVLKKNVEVLHPTDLDFMRGEIHAIVGDHNAGKSLLAKVISGAVEFYEGEILYAGKVLRRYSPVKAKKLGIVTIHQNPTLFKDFSVLDNIIITKRNPSRELRASLAETARQKLNSFAVDVGLRVPIGRCSDSEIVIAYIVRSLCELSKILVVDEISTRLSAAQIDTLKSELSILREKGVTVIYFTSNVEEVFHFADRVSFLQSGKVLATERSSNLGKLELVQLSYSHLYSRKELERSNYELFYLKNYYENIINSMPIPLLLLTSQGNIIYVNDKFEDTYSVEKNEYVGRCVTEILRPGTAEYEHFREADSRAERRVLAFSDVVLAVGDSRVSVRLYEIPINDEDYARLGAILFFDTMRLNVNLEQHNKILQARNKLPLFAHEIRNPLAILSNFLTLIREQSSSRELREYLARSETEIKRINNIVTSLMKEEGPAGEEVETDKTNLWVIAEEIRHLVMPLIADNRIKVRNNTARDVALDHDEDEVKEVLLNLALNSIEASSSDGTIRIGSATETLQAKTYFVITVSDDGEGIPQRDLPKVFEQFFSTKTGKERRGLGLTICKDIVDAWGGMIKVDSTLNVGTTVSVFIPK